MMLAPMNVSLIEDINDRILSGRAVVRSVSELAGEKLGASTNTKVDVVTFAIFSPISSTAAMLCVKVAERGVFTRAEEISLNDVPGLAGPAPNERLGLVDTMVHADTPAKGNPAYTGADLIHDLLSDRSIQAKCVALEGSRHDSVVKLKDFEFARFYIYNARVGMLPDGIVASLGRGSRVLINGANGILLGGGTRDGHQGRSWSLAADMRGMNPEDMVSIGPEGKRRLGNMITVALPIGDTWVLNEVQAWHAGRETSEAEQNAADDLRSRICAGAFTITDTDEPL